MSNNNNISKLSNNKFQEKKIIEISPDNIPKIPGEKINILLKEKKKWRGLSNDQCKKFTPEQLDKMNVEYVKKIWRKLTFDQIQKLKNEKIIEIINSYEFNKTDVDNLLTLLSNVQLKFLNDNISKLRLRDKSNFLKNLIVDNLKIKIKDFFPSAPPPSLSQIFNSPALAKNNNNTIKVLNYEKIYNLNNETLKKLIDENKLNLLNFEQVTYINNKLKHTLLSEEKTKKIKKRLDEISQENNKVAKSFNETTDLSTLTHEQIVKISPDKISQLTSQQIADLKKWIIKKKDNTVQINLKLLTPEQIAAINPKYILVFLKTNTFTDKQYQSLTGDQIQSISPENIGFVITSPNSASLLTQTQISYLTKEQIDKIPGPYFLKFWENLINEQKKMLDNEHLMYIFKSSMNYHSQLKVLELVELLTPKQLADLSNDEIDSIINETIKKKIQELKLTTPGTPVVAPRPKPATPVVAPRPKPATPATTPVVAPKPVTPVTSATTPVVAPKPGTPVTSATTPATPVTSAPVKPIVKPASGTSKIITKYNKTVRITKTSKTGELLRYRAEIIN